MSTIVLETCRRMKCKVILKQKFCASSWLISEINIIYIIPFVVWAVYCECWGHKYHCQTLTKLTCVKQWQVTRRGNDTDLTFYFTYHRVQNSTDLHGAQIAFMCCVVYHNQQRLIFHTVLAYSFRITELESVYSAVWTDSLYKADYVWSLNNRGGKCLQRGADCFLI